MIKDIFWINGEICEQALKPDFVSPPVYEVIRVIDGTPLFFKDHMDRLDHSLDLVGYRKVYEVSHYYSAIRSLVFKTGLLNNNFRIEIGLDAKGGTLCICYPVASTYPESEVYTIGISMASKTIVRENPHAKVFYPSYQNEIAQMKKKRQVYEILLHDDHGKISEGSRSSVFFVKNRTVYSAKSKDILMGITRNKIIEILEEMAIDFVETDLHMKSLPQYDACFISGTSIHVMPVKWVDQIQFNSAANEVVRALINAFKQTVQLDIDYSRRRYND